MPLRPEARAAIEAALDEPPADPARLHTDALRLRERIEAGRDAVAALLGTRNRSVIFTSGATESITTSVAGAAERCSHVVYSMVEHSAVRAASDRWFTTPRHGTEASDRAVTVLQVDSAGRLGAASVAAALDDRPALVHVQWVNHEVGTLQDVKDVVETAHAAGALVHVDAAQAVGKVPVAFDALGADLLSASGHKFGGPPGVGVLLVRRGLHLRPLLEGGAEERHRRAGLENTLAIAGLGAAAEALSPTRIEAERASVAGLSRRLRTGLREMTGVVEHGDPKAAVPHIVNIGLDGLEPQAVLLGLDRAGIAVHSGSACAGEELEPSPVLEAMGLDARRSLRISLGWSSTAADVDALLASLPRIMQRLRALR